MLSEKEVFLEEALRVWGAEFAVLSDYWLARHFAECVMSYPANQLKAEAIRLVLRRRGSKEILKMVEEWKQILTALPNEQLREIIKDNSRVVTYRGIASEILKERRK